MKESNKKRDYIMACIMAVIVGVSLNLKLTVFSIKQLEESAQLGEFPKLEGMHPWFRLVWDFKMSLDGYSIKELLVICLLAVMFYKVWQIEDLRARKCAVVPGLLFAFFEVFGRSFKETAGWEEVFGTTRNLLKAGFKFAGLFLLFHAVCILLLHGYNRVSLAAGENNGEKKWFTCNIKSFFVVFALILLMWLPYAAAVFPGMTNYDFFDELDTFYGNDTNSLRVVVPISDEVTLNNNNPVLQTMMAVTVMKIGNMLGSPYLGIALFCYLQMVVFALILSYSIYYMAKLRIRTGFRVLVLLFYGLLPWHANFALTTLKDTNFAFVMLLYLIFLSDCILHRDTFFAGKGKIIVFALLNLLLMLLRNNGVYVLLVVDVILLFAFRREWKKMLVPTVVPVFVYMVLILHVLYPALKISPGSKAEMYSVPFQQIARLVKEQGDHIAKEDREVIGKVLTKYDELAERYNPELADPVKSTYNKYTTSAEMSDFLKVWAKYLGKYPSLYVQATMCGCYGYFYPEAEHWLVYTQIEPPGLNYGVKSPEKLRTWRMELNQMSYIIKQIPGLGMLVSLGFYTWLLIFQIVYLVYRKEYRKILLWTPIIVLILTVLVGPANTMPRYVYPMVLSMPLLWGLSRCRIRPAVQKSTGEGENTEMEESI